MFYVMRDGSRADCSEFDLPDACRAAIRLQAELFDAGERVNCLAVLGLDRPGLFDAPRPAKLKPTAAEVRALAQVAGLNGSQVAALVGGDPRKFRAWVGAESGMPWAAWHVLAVYVRLSEPMRGEFVAN